MRLTHTPPSLLVAAVAVFMADLAGFLAATTTGLSGVSHAIVSGTSINAPAPFVVVQMTLAGLAVACRGRIGGTIAAALLVPLCLVSVLSGFADGSFGDSALGGGDIAVQAAIVAATAVLGTLAAGQVATALRGRSLSSVAS